MSKYLMANVMAYNGIKPFALPIGGNGPRYTFAHAQALMDIDGSASSNGDSDEHARRFGAFLELRQADAGLCVLLSIVALFVLFVAYFIFWHFKHKNYKNDDIEDDINCVDCSKINPSEVLLCMQCSANSQEHLLQQQQQQPQQQQQRNKSNNNNNNNINSSKNGKQSTKKHRKQHADVSNMLCGVLKPPQDLQTLAKSSLNKPKVSREKSSDSQRHAINNNNNNNNNNSNRKSHKRRNQNRHKLRSIAGFEGNAAPTKVNRSVIAAPPLPPPLMTTKRTAKAMTVTLAPAPISTPTPTVAKATLKAGNRGARASGSQRCSASAEVFAAPNALLQLLAKKLLNVSIAADFTANTMSSNQSDAIEPYNAGQNYAYNSNFFYYNGNYVSWEQYRQQLAPPPPPPQHQVGPINVPSYFLTYNTTYDYYNNNNNNNNNAMVGEISYSKCYINCSTPSTASEFSSSTNGTPSSSASSSPMPSCASSGSSSRRHAMPNAPARTLHSAERAQRERLRLCTPTRRILTEAELYDYLKPYVIERALLRIYGYPIESAIDEHAVEIYKCHPEPAGTRTMRDKLLAVLSKLEARERHCGGSVFDVALTLTIAELAATANQAPNYSTQPQAAKLVDMCTFDGLFRALAGSETARLAAHFTNRHDFNTWDESVGKKCARCKSLLVIDEAGGRFATLEKCCHHPGKLHTSADRVQRSWSCCNALPDASDGCAAYESHVWSGTEIGMNGPYKNYLETMPAPSNDNGSNSRPLIYALDCEMSYTLSGLSATKISVVGSDGRPVYGTFVQPDEPVIDYNTQYSGVSAADFVEPSNYKSLAEVQADLMALFDSETILIGHGLENDLRALRIVHKTVIDTAVVYAHPKGYPYRQSLRTLAGRHLQRDIQQSENGQAGHDCLEDAYTCLALMLKRIELDETSLSLVYGG